MATQAEAARAITYNALRLFHEGQDCIQEVTMAKLITQRGVLEIADECLQIHGGYGYMREYGIERAVRDARLGPIGGGTRRDHEGDRGQTVGAMRMPERGALSGGYDVVICGASFGGLAVARELAGSGASVLVLDRYKIGERPTSACGIPTEWLRCWT